MLVILATAKSQNINLSVIGQLGPVVLLNCVLYVPLNVNEIKIFHAIVTDTREINIYLN